MEILENSKQEEVKIQSEVKFDELAAPQAANVFPQEVPKATPQPVSFFENAAPQSSNVFSQEPPKAPQSEAKSDFGNLLEDFAPSFAFTQESKSVLNPQPSNFGENQANPALASASAIPQNINYQNIPPQPSGNAQIASNVQPNNAQPLPQNVANNIPPQMPIYSGAIPLQPTNISPPPPAKVEIPVVGQVAPEMANMNQYQSSQIQPEEKKIIDEAPPQPAMEVINANEPGFEQKQEQETPEKNPAFYNGNEVEGVVEGKRERLPSDYDATETELIQKRQQKDMERRALLVDKAMEEQKKKKEMQINAEQELKDWIE